MANEFKHKDPGTELTQARVHSRLWRRSYLCVSGYWRHSLRFICHGLIQAG
jgi:hypothetical protein